MIAIIASIFFGLALVVLPSANAVVNFKVIGTRTEASGTAFTVGEQVTVNLTTINGLGAPPENTFINDVYTDFSGSPNIDLVSENYANSYSASVTSLHSDHGSRARVCHSSFSHVRLSGRSCFPAPQPQKKQP
ncbi:hypothetical protein SH580_07280 [Coraliomargarita algicola]|uniref:DUF11 domain-containing protein n=1 Tax=Coraliomargarita algicola TaxID=3092156 RepID=A0ABZ0RRA6_9BACT|nr:hypothetical protein [Coraliomargarita sp. J2-16]WPJ97510.1 hypothetical protein SH580_07280 [Coraliomargarita sp. J2-16]